ncbi:glycosyltransferase family 39 protein [Ktedonosporobacter rubrisoli]|nr:glycosyltransferase family 39 protein [Ktedonosporobacter rubrisoli]
MSDPHGEYTIAIQQAATEDSPRAPARSGAKAWPSLALALILLLSIFLNFFNLTQNGYGNPYYAAAVKSMLTSWHNFFFVSLDSGGFVMIDKPPLAFWLQASSAGLFGFSGLSLLIPEALAGVASVAILYILVRRSFGTTTGLLAALALAITPICIVTDRSNTPDSLLVLVTLLATWMIFLATETGKLRWLLLSALLLGIGFNIKMLQAYLVIPAFALLYLLGAPLRLRTRLLHLALAGVVLALISLSWIVAVDLTPVTQRPYVGSSPSNSEIDLAFGYNGIQRLLGFLFHSSGVAAPLGGSLYNGMTLLIAILEAGLPSPIRVFNQQLGSQIGWLVPLAVYGLIVAIGRRQKRAPLTREGQGMILWGTWFLTMLIFFSLALNIHTYYLVMLAPAICALAAIGLLKLWAAYGKPGWRGWLLPLALANTAACQWFILTYYPGWRSWLSPLILVVCILAALLLVVARLFAKRQNIALTGPATSVALLALLIGPAIWSCATPLQVSSPLLLRAGPAAQATGYEEATEKLMNSFIPDSTRVDPALERYLLAHQGQTRYLLVTLNGVTAAPLILDTAKPVMALGGFIGIDPILSQQQFKALVAQNVVRYIMVPAPKIDLRGLPPQLLKMMGGSDNKQQARPGKAKIVYPLQSQIMDWVFSSCTYVKPTELQPDSANPDQAISIKPGGALSQIMFDCASHH